MLDILFLDDDVEDVRMFGEQLQRAGVGKVTGVADRDGLASALEQRKWDLVLLDYNVPTLKDGAALDLAIQLQPDTPRILLTGSISDTAAAEVSKGRVADYIIKDHSARLPQAVQQVHEFWQAKANLAKAQQLINIGTLTAGITHDLNNQLMPVYAALHILRGVITKQDVRTPEENLHTIDTALHCMTRGTEILHQVLAFLRGVNGHARKVLNVGELVTDLGNFIKATFPKSIKIDTMIEVDLPRVQGDATQLNRVLLNMCMNAKDAITSVGTITLHVNSQDLHDYQAMPDTHLTGKFVVIAISDDGTGMQPEVAKRIFEPFFTTKPPGKGTGLGLSTSMETIRSHGGSLGVDTTPGLGTTFSIYLPALAKEVVVDKVHADDQGPRGHGELVLVVDDQEAILDLTSLLLEVSGYKVIRACNGVDALRSYETHLRSTELQKVYAVLTDMSMPVMDGIELITRLRAIDPNVKALCMSGFDSKTAMEGRELSGLEMLPKPCTAQVLLTRLASVATGTPA